jgi:Helix-turn-helix domain
MAAIRLGAGAVIELEGASLEALADLVADRLEERGVSEPEPWLGVQDAAAYLGCSTDRIYELVSLRKGNPDAGLEFRKDGSRLVFRREWLDAVLERP